MSTAGILMNTGTDVPSPFQESGVHGEMELMVAAGLTPFQALRAATLDAARCAGLDQDVGSVEVNKIADLLLVEGDPTTDITATRKISAVVVGGHVLTPAEIRDRARNQYR